MTDLHGTNIIDPSLNVKTLIKDAIKSERALREQSIESIRHELKIEVSHAKELRELNDERLKSIREVDVKAVADTATTVGTTAATLATQVATTAEAARSATADATIATDAKIRSEVDPLKKDISELRQSQYEGVGAKAQVVETRSDHADDRPILDAIAKLTDAQAQSTGARAQVVQAQAKSSNYGLWIGLGVAAFFGFTSFLVSIAGLALVILLK